MKNVWLGNGFAYWQIPRCAGTSTAKWLEAAGFDQVDDSAEFGDGIEHFTVVRDPVQRYISCLSLAWEHDRPGPWPDFIQMVNQWNEGEGGVWDWYGNEHFLTQSRYLERMPDANLFDITGLGYLGNWLRQRGVAVGMTPHERKGSPARIEFATEMLAVEPVMDHYAEDYTLLV